MAKPQIKSLPIEEWDFSSPKIIKPPLWQWNDWLNYEYARSCRPIVEAVLELRARKIPEREAGSFPPPAKYPRHAVYLAHNYPDFPLKPWLKLTAAHRDIRNETGDHVGGPFEEEALEILDTFEFEYRIATGDIWLDSQNISDQKYSVFKIDFLRDKKLIEKKFRFWLKRRQTEYLKKRTVAMEKLSQAAKPPKRKKEVHSGHAQNRRNYTAAFKQLAALRLLEHFQYDYIRCGQETTQDEHDTPLYYDMNNTRWFEAANNATARLVRFHIMWTLEMEPAYFFKFAEFHEVLKWYPKLEADLARTKSRNQLKELLKRLFCGYTDRQQICGLR